MMEMLTGIFFPLLMNKINYLLSTAHLLYKSRYRPRNHYISLLISPWVKFIWASDRLQSENEAINLYN